MNTNTDKIAEQVVLGSLPAEILGADVPTQDTRVAVASAVSLATRNQRTWDNRSLRAACRAARPAVERDLRSRGRAFSRDDVNTEVKKRVRAYADQYGVRLPDPTVLGRTSLEVVAGEICGSFSLPWTTFLPPQVKAAAKMAESGSPKARAWLSKFFGGKSQAAPAPAPTPVAKSEAPAEKTESSGSGDSLGAWLHQLNPLYWVKSAQERALIDKERQAWIDNAELQKKLEKREVVLQQGQKAVDAKRAVAAAQARSADLEAQLKSIESQLSGACSLGAEPIGLVTKDGINIVDPRKTTESFVGEDEDPFARNVPGVDAAPVLDKVKKARQLNSANAADLAPIAAKLKSGAPLSPQETSQVLVYLSRNEQLHEFRKRLVSGDACAGNPSQNKIQRHVVLGAVKAMTPTEQKMVAQMTAMAKAGNANAARALQILRSQGYAVTPPPPSTSVGSLIDDTFRLATSAVKLPFKAAYQGTKWLGRKTGIIKGGSSPEQVRLARLRAASKRGAAARARARAADAQTEAEYRVQQQFAAAADAEADAADAEANAKEAQMLTAESEYAPGVTADEAADSSGASRPTITPLPPTPSPTAEKFRADRSKVVAKKNPKAAKILAASQTNTPAGIKLRASMELYKKAEKRGSKERRAVRTMIDKAKRGDKQALADVNALKLASAAVKAERKAGKHVARVYAYRAATAKVRAAKARTEVALGDRLARGSRSRELNKLAKVENRASRGDRRCQTFVKKHVALAKKGDPKSKKVVDALKLVRAERLATPNRRERRNLAQARKLVRRVSRGDRGALAQVRIVEAAAAHGNPNAVRAKKRLQTAAARELTIKHGVIVVPGVVVTASLAKKQKRAKKSVSKAESKIAAGTATREEVMAASKAAADAGDRVKSGELAAQAAVLPSAKDSLQKVAPVLAAASAGNPQAAEAIKRASEQASSGDARGIETMGKVAAVKAMNDVAQGRPVEPEMRDAVRAVEAAQAGDPAARETLAKVREQAKEGVPEAVKAAVYASGAVAVSRALASSPQAKDEWRQRSGLAPLDTSREDTQVAPPREPGQAPDMLGQVAPLRPVRGIVAMLGAALRALSLSTSAPFQNHEEGLAALAARGGSVSAGEEEIPSPKKPGPEKKRRATAKKEELDPDVEYRVHGEANVESSPAFKAAVAKLRDQFSEARERAAGGHPPSVQLLRKANDDFAASLKRADGGDAGAQTRVKIYRAAGLFKTS